MTVKIKQDNSKKLSTSGSPIDESIDRKISLLRKIIFDKDDLFPTILPFLFFLFLFILSCSSDLNFA